MAKKPNLAGDINYLLEKTELLLKKSKTELKKKAPCKIEGCLKPVSYRGLCIEHLEEDKANRGAASIGRRWISTNGYEYVYNEEMKPVLYHRYRMEQILGRSLQEHEVVKHLDGSRANNEDSNLVLTTKAGINLLELECPHCSNPYFSKPS